jgi:uncharacterized protein (TIGR02145 family)
MANISWLVQSCCNPSTIEYVEIDSFLLFPGVSFQDSLGNCYTVIEQSEEIPTIFFTNRIVYNNCLECTQENPCNPPVGRPKIWLVQSCCNLGVTQIISDNTLLPGDIFQDINGNCYTVLTITSGFPTIVRGNSEVYRTCDACKPCASPSPTPTPSITQTPFPTPSTTPSVTVTPSPTTYNFANSSPSPTPTVTKTVTPSVTPSINTPECKCITFTNTDASSSYNCFYTNCAGTTNIRFSLGPEDIAQVCGSDPSVQDPAVTFYTGSYCQGGQCVRPDTSPSPTPTPSITPVSGSFVSPDDLCMDVVFGPAPSVSATPSVTVSVTPSITVSSSPFSVNPSITPTSTPSVTPSVTPSKTPSISVSTTPSTTPSVTPTKTVTPSLTPSKTPSITISPTKTPTPSPSPSRNALVVSECAVLIISTVGKIYAYDSTTNTSTLLPIPTTFSSDIAHTTDKLWLTVASGTGPNIIEYNITLSPFTATYNRTLPLPVGYTAGAGLCAINNTTLISSVFPPFSTEQIVQITLNPDNTTTLTTLFPQIPGRRVSGDIVYTTNNKIILTTYTDAPMLYYVSQYTLVNEVWTLEFDLDVTNTSPYNLGLATLNNGIYTFSGNTIKQINNLFPYNVTQINNTGIVVGGASQVPSCNNVSFQPNIVPASPSPTPTPTKTVTPSITVSPSITPSRTPSVTPSTSPPNNTPCNGNGILPLPGNNITYNGITITASGTGVSTLYPSSYASCNTTTPAGTVILGNSGNFSYTLTFNQPVNNIKLPITALGTNPASPTSETFIFTTGGGTPTITSPNSCQCTINGNLIIANNPTSGTGGGGLFTISAPSPFTTLTITGPGGAQGSIFGIDCASILPPPPADCVSCNVQALPTLGNGTITNGNLTVSTTYNGPTIPTFPNTFPIYDNCVGLPAPGPGGTIILGNQPGPFTYILNFNQPVNNIKFLITGGGFSGSDLYESFTFNTSGGVPILSACGTSCGVIINNNILQLTLALPYGGGVLTQVKATNPYTQIIITGNGGLAGSSFNLCLDTAIPVPSPSPTPTPTKTATPSKTPSVTVSPSKTLSVTPSVTVSPSKTPSITPSPTPNSGCNTMLYRSQTRGYGSYNFTTNTATALTVAANPYPANDITNNLPTVIANTSNKMWVYATGATTSEINLRESNITLSPFTSTFNRNIALPSFSKPGNGLFALNNTTLVGTFETFNGISLNSIQIVELNITGNIATSTVKCIIPTSNKPVGGLIVTTGPNPKLLILTRYGANGSYFINQYNYTTGVLEFRKSISPTVLVPSGLAEINGNIYIIGSNVYKIDTVAPYNLTLIQTVIGSQIINTSQLALCIDTILPTGSCTDCNANILSPTNILTYNGVTIIPSYVGPPSIYPNGTSYNVDAICTDDNALLSTSNTIILGASNNTGAPGPFSYTLTFSQPVNNIKLIIGGMGGVTYTTQESFAFNTNGGIPTISSCRGCFDSINGNTITGSLANITPQGNGITAGGIITITSPNNYTTLTISGPGGVLGSTFAICTNSITPVPQPSPSPTPSTSPTCTPCSLPDVVIGTQTWKGCNLDVTTYRNGDPILYVPDPIQWANLTVGAWCYYNNDPTNNCKYGKLYNWYAVNDPRGLAPAGYHVPSSVEWGDLIRYLDPNASGLIYTNNNAGGKVKTTGTIEAGTGLWISPNVGATNETGWTGVPGGGREGTQFGGKGYDGVYWASDTYPLEAGTSYYVDTFYWNDQLAIKAYYKNAGKSIRCIKDSAPTLGCVYYNGPNGNLYNYNVTTGASSSPITLSNLGAVFSQNDTHTLNKYWKANNTNLIQEWIPSNNPTIFNLNRNISVNTGYAYFYYAFAIDNNTLLAVATNAQASGQSGYINSTLIRINITNNTITPAQVTSLFTVGGSTQTSLGWGSMLLTTTNKLLYIGTRPGSNNSSLATIYQYSYPDGALEGTIDLSSQIPNWQGSYVKLFESGGNIFFALNNPPTLTPTTIYRINLSSPYSISPIVALPGLNQGFNSSINCNTVNFNVSSPQPSPSPTPSTSPPPANFRTIYKYLDIQ